MNSKLIKILICPKCHKPDTFDFSDNLVDCISCNNKIQIIHETLDFLKSKDNNFIDLPAKSPGKGSYFRKQNWKFNEKIAANLKPNQIVLEVGCGRGYYKPLFGENYIGTDISLRPAADFVCDLVDQKCLKDESVDVLLLNNVIEHVYDFFPLMENCVKSLKKNGLLIITVPYTSTLHQTPADYFRYTEFALKKIIEQLNLKINIFEAVYQPYTQLNRAYDIVIDSLPNGFKNQIAKNILHISKMLFNSSISFIKEFHPEGSISIMDSEKHKHKGPYSSPVGYQIIAEKN